MTTLESPMPTVETDKSIIDDKEDKVCKDSNGQVQHSHRKDSDPWAFLEHELDEFKRIVAELENLKIPAIPIVEKTHPNENVNGSNVFAGNGNPDCNVNATEQLPGASKKHQPQQTTVSINVTEADGETTLDNLVSDDIPKKDLLEDDAKNKEFPTNPKDDTRPTTDNEINSPVERLKINVSLPDTPEPGPIENKNKSVVIQKRPKPLPPPKPNLKPKPKISSSQPETSQEEKSFKDKISTFAEAIDAQQRAMQQQPSSSPSYKSSVSYTTV